jgi:hypothetical protein
MGNTPEIAAMDPADLREVVALWERAGLTRPHNDPVADIGFALAGPASTILVGRIAGAIAGAVMVGHDGHRGAVYYLAVDPPLQGRGLGRLLLDSAEQWLRSRGVCKLNLMIRPENAAVRAFYEACGYAVEDRLVMAHRLDGV